MLDEAVHPGRQSGGGESRTRHRREFNFDSEKLLTLVQSRRSTYDDELTGHSSNVTDGLTDMLEKAQTEIDGTDHSESNAAHDFAMLKRPFEDRLAQDNEALEKGCWQEHLQPGGVGPRDFSECIPKELKA